MYILNLFKLSAFLGIIGSIGIALVTLPRAKESRSARTWPSSVCPHAYGI